MYVSYICYNLKNQCSCVGIIFIFMQLFFLSFSTKKSLIGMLVWTFCYSGSGADSWILTIGASFQIRSQSPVSGVLQLTMEGTSLKDSVPLTLSSDKSQFSINYTLSNASTIFLVYCIFSECTKILN